MAVTNPPWACQGRTDHPAVLVRLAQAGLATAPGAAGITSPVGGVNTLLGNRLAVTGLASMNVQVDTGLAYIPNTTAWNGMYAAYQSSTTNVAIGAASGTQWRSDYIVAQITDPGDNTAAWSLADIQGTFSSSSPGALPSLPANSIPLAIIRVVPNMTVTNGGGTVVDARIWQPLTGTLTTTSSTKPSLSAPEGTMWFETDTNQLGIIVNGAYQYILIGSAADTYHTVTYVNGFAAASGLDLKYTLETNGRVSLSGIVAIPSGSIGANPANICSLPNSPINYRPNRMQQWPQIMRVGTTITPTYMLALTTGEIQIVNPNSALSGNIPINVSYPVTS